jgi:hypothetical protein
VRLKKPTMLIWVIALILGILGLLGYLMTIRYISDAAFWLEFAGLALILIATGVRGF